MLPKQSPENLFGLIHPNKEILTSLLEMAGSPFWSNSEDATSPVVGRVVAEGVDRWRDGHVAMALASEIILLLRQLLEGQWKLAVISALTGALKKIPAITARLQSGDVESNTDAPKVPSSLPSLPPPQTHFLRTK